MVKGQLNGVKLGVWPLIRRICREPAESLILEKYAQYADDTRYSGAHTMSIVTIEAIDPSLTLFTGSK